LGASALAPRGEGRFTQARKLGPDVRSGRAARRRVASAPDWAREVSAAQLPLLERYEAAVIDMDRQALDDVLADYRDLHARYGLESKPRWPTDIRAFAFRLQHAGQRLGRLDLLEQAADAWGQAIVAGPPAHDYDPGSAWRGLGQTLVELARLDDRRSAAVAEALDAFDRALTLDRDSNELFGYRPTDLVGRAEAHLILAGLGDRSFHLDAAGKALEQARPLLRPSARDRWRSVEAERLALLPPAEVSDRDRARALRGLDQAIARDKKDEGSPLSNPARLERLKQLRAVLAGAAGRP
jgi:tetratricopeptide (TPR) repeat protein